MFIYVVKPNDSLYSISKKYDVAVDKIRLVNGLVQDTIVPGQAILMVTYTYIVQPGDNLYAIAKMAMMSPGRLQQANPSYHSYNLKPGQKLTIPRLNTYEATALGYYTLRTPEKDRALINDLAPYTTYIGLFDYHFNTSGTLSALNDAPAIQTSKNRGVKPLMTVTNITSLGFSSNVSHTVLNNPHIRRTLINNIFQTIVQKGYAGVNIDIELNRTEDRDIFSGFLKALKDKLYPSGYLLTIAVPPKTNENIPWLKGYDYGAIGSVVDYVFLMAYDWHHGSSEPGPVAPLQEVEKTIQYALKNMSRNKIILGLPLYGYNWTLPYQQNRVYPGISSENAIQLAIKHQAPIQYSTTHDTPYFKYQDEQGVQHVVWFEDSRSMSKKMELVRKYGIVGVGAWQLTLGFPEGTWLLTKFFQIKK